MIKNKNIPKIRFKEFEEEWNSKRINEMVSLVTREVPKPTHAYKRLSIRSHAKGSFHQIVEKPETVAMNKLFVVHENDLVVSITFAWEHAITVAKLEDDGLLVSHRFPTYEMNESDPYFIRELVYQNSFKKKMDLISLGGAGRNRVLNKNDFGQIFEIIPSKLEQSQIGTFFKYIDSLISDSQQKFEKTINLKKACLEKMFPKKGEKIPEMRFEGFEGEWEENVLGEIGNTYTGLSGKIKGDFGHGDAYYVTYLNIFTNPIAEISDVGRIEIDIKQNMVQYGDVFFTTSSETPEEVGMSSVWLYNNENVYLNSFCFGFRPSIKFDHYFLAYFLRTSRVRSEFKLLAQGSTRFNISKTETMKIKLIFPNELEQQVIGTYFRELDKLISLYQQEISKLQNIKKAFLQSMFV